jgi:hypothetical protein
MEASRLVRHNRNLAARFVPRYSRSGTAYGFALPEREPSREDGNGAGKVLTKPREAGDRAVFPARSTIAVVLDRDAEVAGVLRLAGKGLKRGWAARFR